MKKSALALLILAGCQHQTADIKTSGYRSPVGAIFTASIDDESRMWVVRSETAPTFKGVVGRERDGVCEQAEFEIDLDAEQVKSTTKILEPIISDRKSHSVVISNWMPSIECVGFDRANDVKFSSTEISTALLSRGPQIEFHSQWNWGFEALPLEYRIGTVHATLALGDGVGVLIDVRDNSIVGVAENSRVEGSAVSIFSDDRDEKIGQKNMAMRDKIMEWDARRTVCRDFPLGQDCELTYGKDATESFVHQLLKDLEVVP